MIDMRELSINERVARCRKMAGLRQEDLAKKMGMKSSTYSQMERAGEITAVRLIQIADILGISSQILFLGADEAEKTVSTPPIPQPPENPNGPKQPPIIVDPPLPPNPPIPEPNPPIFTAEEEKYFKIVHDFPGKYKQEVFDFIQEKYRESRYKNKK